MNHTAIICVAPKGADFIMTLTIELPEDLALYLTEWLPEEKIAPYVASAAWEGIRRWEEQDARLLASLNARLNPELEPERDAAEYCAIIEAELADPDFLKNTISLEEAFCRAEEALAEFMAGKKL